MKQLTKLAINLLKLLKDISKMYKNAKNCHISRNFMEITDFAESLWPVLRPRDREIGPA